jgi:hypothetical protein
MRQAFENDRELQGQMAGRPAILEPTRDTANDVGEDGCEQAGPGH